MSIDSNKCSQCGAPINWEKASLIVKCEFCGKPNSLSSKYLLRGQNSLLRVNGFLSKVASPFSKQIKQKGAVLLEKQNLLSTDQIDWVTAKLKSLVSKKRNITIVSSIPIAFVLFSMASNPINQHRKSIENYCRKSTSSIENNFTAKQEFSECKKERAREIVERKKSLIEKKGRIRLERKDLIKELVGICKSMKEHKLQYDNLVKNLTTYVIASKSIPFGSEKYDEIRANSRYIIETYPSITSVVDILEGIPITSAQVNKSRYYLILDPFISSFYSYNSKFGACHRNNIRKIINSINKEPRSAYEKYKRTYKDSAFAELTDDGSFKLVELPF